MNTSMRVLLDIAFRSVALLVLSEGVAEIYAAAEPNDGGGADLGIGLTVMFVLVCAAASWGFWDGFHRNPARLCVTWVTTGLGVSLGQTLYLHLRSGEWSWSELSHNLSGGLVFWASLIIVPAITFGIVQSATRGSTEVPVRHVI